MNASAVAVTALLLSAKRRSDATGVPLSLGCPKARVCHMRYIRHYNQRPMKWNSSIHLAESVRNQLLQSTSSRSLSLSGFQ